MPAFTRTHAPRVQQVLFVLTFVAGILGSSRSTRASTIQVGANCSISNAATAANWDQPIGGCSSGAAGHDDIVIPPGLHSINTAIEIWSDVTLKSDSAAGGDMWNTIVASANVNPPSPNTFMLPDHCGANAASSGVAAVYVNAWDIDTGAILPVIIQDITLVGTGAGWHQGICHVAGNLTLNRSRITTFPLRGVWVKPYDAFQANFKALHTLIDSNHANADGFGGAGLYFSDYGVAGDLLIDHSTISNNSSDDRGGGISTDGDQQTNRWIRNSTISGNYSATNGGGIYYHLESYLEVDFSTVAFNYAQGFGGGIFKPSAPGNMSLYESIISNNTAVADSQQANLNLVSNNNSITCRDSLIYLTGSGWTSSTLPGNDASFPCEFGTADANLGSLIGQGGRNNLPVHPPLSGSHAIDAAERNGYADDQRGGARPVDGDSNGTKISDRGAFELNPFQFETEDLAVAVKSSDTHWTQANAAEQASGERNTNLQANAANDYVTYRTSSIPAGTYAVVVRFKKQNNGGRFQLSRSNTQNGTYSNLGGVQDSYSANTTWTTASLGSITFSSSGQKYFRFLVTGKSGSSSSYQLFPDALTLVKQ